MAITNEMVIAALRARGISEQSLTDNTIEALITDALGTFSLYRPILIASTFGTKAGQNVYSWEAIGDPDGVELFFCIWGSGEQLLPSILAGYGYRDEPYWHLPSQAVLDELKSSDWAKKFTGTGFQIDPIGGSIHLSPCPQSDGLIVFIIYSRPHASLATIKPADFPIFLDLMESLCSISISSLLSDSVIGGRIRTPEYEIENAQQIARWDNRASRAWDKFISAVQAGHALGTRS